MECESLWMDPYCHSPEEEHQGTALPQPQEPPWAAGCPHPTSIPCLRGSSGYVLAYGYPPPKLTHSTGLSFSFAFLFSPHFPGFWGPFHPPFVASGLWCGGCWFWEVSSRWFSWWLVNFPQQQEQEPTSLGLPSEPSVSGGGELTPVASKETGVFCTRQLQQAPKHLQKWNSGCQLSTNYS